MTQVDWGVAVGTILVEVFFLLLTYLWGYIDGRRKQRDIESTACLHPYEYEGKRYFIRLYDSREASIDGKAWEE